jgi:hypothetical protein
MIEAYKKICHQLNLNKVEYLVIGGVAVIAHGYPRSTVTLIFGIDQQMKTIKDYYLPLEAWM